MRSHTTTDAAIAYQAKKSQKTKKKSGKAAAGNDSKPISSSKTKSHG